MWIFGYGSLVWKPGFAFVERHPGFIEGFARRFWQGSTDHRGVPGAPGRVVTLVPEPEATTWGIVFRIEGAEKDRVLARLDHREKGGYARHRVAVHTSDAAGTVEALVYLATESNPNYLGPAPLDAIASQVVASHGPSGPNVEYVLELDTAMRAIDADDPHLYSIADAVRRKLSVKPA